MTGSHGDGLDPTKKLPTTVDYGYQTDAFTDPYGAPVQPPTGRHRWLWPVAGAAVILALCTIIALVIVNSSEQQTLVAPPPLPVPSQDGIPTSTTATTTTPATSDSAEPPGDAISPPVTTSAPDGTDTGETETVLYSVIGTGRAMSITYVDTGNVLQTEFNVPLPWTREVQLNRPATRSASVSIVNAGRGIACTISVDGTQVQQREGIGLTICRTAKRGRATANR
ncbi:MAG: MmpS family transport accessory protein [Mycobacterium sp.]|nr:MmpS family transport accessory protein [Mycobacterium sp.]